MISIKINDIKNFMNHLLINDTFDHFLIKEGEVNTSHFFKFDGRINEKFFSEDELKNLTEDFPSWKEEKNIFFNIIKGNKVPTEMKFTFSMPKSSYNNVITEAGLNIEPNNIGGLYLHCSFANNNLNIITGTTLNIFTMDKTLDKYWDNLMFNFLQKHFDVEKSD